MNRKPESYRGVCGGVIYPQPQQGNCGRSVVQSFLHPGCSQAADVTAPSSLPPVRSHPLAAGANTFALLAELSAGGWRSRDAVGRATVIIYYGP